MPKAKRAVIKKSSIQDLQIEERIAAAGRGEKDHIIYLGVLVEKILQGEFGSILKALTAGRISMELSNRTILSADRILGRCEMADQLWKDLEQYVLDKDMVMKPEKPAEPEKFMHTAQEPVPDFIPIHSYTGIG